MILVSGLRDLFAGYGYQFLPTTRESNVFRGRLSVILFTIGLMVTRSLRDRYASYLSGYHA